MAVVTEINLIKESFKNLKTVLDTNTNSYKVTPALSKNSSIPIIILSISFDEGDVYTDGSGSYLATARISAIGKDVQTSQELAEEAKNLILSADDTLDSLGMQIQGKPVILDPIQVPRGEGTRVFYTDVAFRFVIQ